MKKKMFAAFLAFCLLLTAAIPAAAAETDAVAPDQCGDNLTWSFADGVLTITGDGDMYDYLEGGPWSAHIEEIRKIVFDGSITYVGAYAFRDYDALEEVDFGDSMHEIGMEAFRDCDGLTKIYLPEMFKIFGESSFESCDNLTEIHSEGRFPSFHQNSLWETYATIYFPVERPWDVELIKELETAFHGRIEFLASDGSDPYDPMAETAAPETEAPTTEVPTTAAPTTVPPTTQAPTEVPETQPAPIVEDVTEAPTEPLLIAPAPTEPVEETENDTVTWIVGGVLVGSIVLLAILCKLIFGGKKGKYSR